MMPKLTSSQQLFKIGLNFPVVGHATAVFAFPNGTGVPTVSILHPQNGQKGILVAAAASSQAAAVASSVTNSPVVLRGASASSDAASSSSTPSTTATSTVSTRVTRLGTPLSPIKESR